MGNGVSAPQWQALWNDLHKLARAETFELGEAVNRDPSKREQFRELLDIVHDFPEAMSEGSPPERARLRDRFVQYQNRYRDRRSKPTDYAAIYDKIMNDPLLREDPQPPVEIDGELYPPEYLRNVANVRRSQVYDRVMTKAVSDARLTTAIGSPIEAGLPQGSVTDIPESPGPRRSVLLRLLDQLRLTPFGEDLPASDEIAAYAHLMIPVTGPDGAAKIYVLATRGPLSEWKLHRVYAVVTTSEQLVDLLCDSDPVAEE